jgi:hypothetical protein
MKFVQETVSAKQEMAKIKKKKKKRIQAEILAQHKKKIIFKTHL